MPGTLHIYIRHCRTKTSSPSVENEIASGFRVLLRLAKDSSVAVTPATAI